MCKFDEEEVQKKIDECSTRSEEELLNELSDADISENEFANFRDLIMPMLSTEQAKKLDSIISAVRKEK